MVVSQKNEAQWARGTAAWAYRRDYAEADTLFSAEAAMAAAIEPLADMAMLDIGVGVGRTCGWFAPRVRTYAGIDYSPTMAAAAKARFPNLDIAQADARDLSRFGDGSFDLVLFSFNGVDYVDHLDRLKIFAEVRRVLQPEGWFLFSTHNRAAKIKSAYSLSHIKPTLNPLRLAKSVLGWGVGMVNHARLSALQQETPDFAIRNDEATYYSLLTYYIHPEDQRRQLTDAGFQDVGVFALDGARFDGTVGCTDYMLHYMARRTASAAKL